MTLTGKNKNIYFHVSPIRTVSVFHVLEKTICILILLNNHNSEQWHNAVLHFQNTSQLITCMEFWHSKISATFSSGRETVQVDYQCCKGDSTDTGLEFKFIILNPRVNCISNSHTAMKLTVYIEWYQNALLLPILPHLHRRKSQYNVSSSSLNLHN